MKSFRNIFIILLLCFVPIIGRADSVSINCDKTYLYIDEMVSCTIKGNTNNVVNSVNMYVNKNSDVLKVMAIEKVGSWEGAISENHIMFYGDDRNSNFDIAKVSFKALSEGNCKVSLDNVIYTNGKFEDVSIGSANIAILATKRPEIKPSNPESNGSSGSNLDSNNYLNYLIIEGVEFEFDKNTTSYTIMVDDLNEIEIKGEALSKKALAFGFGNYELNEGRNIISVIVTAENGENRIYTLNIYKGSVNYDEFTPEDAVASVTINNVLGTFNFNPNVHNYNVEIDKNTSMLDIKYELVNGTNATAKIVNNENLANGVMVSLVVEYNGACAEYVFTIKSENEMPKERLIKNDYILYLIIGGVCLVISIVIIILSSKANKKKQEARRKANQDRLNEMLRENEGIEVTNTSPINNSEFNKK